MAPVVEDAREVEKEALRVPLLVGVLASDSVVFCCDMHCQHLGCKSQ